MFEIGAAGQLTVSRGLDGQTARVRVATLDRRAPYTVAVAPAPDGGWHVADPSDPEPTWYPSRTAALDEAIALAASVLAERLGRAPDGQDATATNGRYAPTFDVC